MVNTHTIDSFIDRTNRAIGICFLMVIIAMVSLVASSSVTAATINVPADYPTIQEAIDSVAMHGDIITVDPNTYTENLDFLNKVFTLKGSGAGATIIAGLLECNGAKDPNMIIEGVIITKNGFGMGGIWVSQSTLVIRDCVMQHLGPLPLASFPRSAIEVNESTCFFEHCDFIDNESFGISNMTINLSTTNFDHCNFIDNNIYESNGYAHGGAVCCTYSDATFRTCNFVKNTSYAGDGGNDVSTGGAIANYDTDLVIEQCTFIANRTLSPYGGGGAIYCRSNNGNLMTLTNSLFVANNVGSFIGGALYLELVNPVITECTFAYNTINRQDYGEGGAIRNNYDASPVITNSIFWGNRASEGGQISNGTYSNPVIRASCIENSGGSGIGWDHSLGIDGHFNIAIDPGFVLYPDSGPDGLFDGVDDNYGDLHLNAGSLCIDSADGDVVTEGYPIDLDGNMRIVDMINIANSGNGLPVDMGAYEYQSPCTGNMNISSNINLTDFFILASMWMQVDCDHCNYADVTDDQNVNTDDLLQLANNWLCGG